MACMSCKKKAAARAASNGARPSAEDTGVIDAKMQSLYDTGEFEFVRYMGASYSHIVAPITTAIVKFGLNNYGPARKGNVLLIHKEDIKAKPELFVAIKKNSPVYKAQLNKIERMADGRELNEKVQPIIPEAIADNQLDSADTPDEEVVEKDTKDTDVKVNSDSILVELKKSDALSLDDYAFRFGYTHRLQVLGLVKSGKLKSFKNEEDKTMVYTTED